MFNKFRLFLFLLFFGNCIHLLAQKDTTQFVTTWITNNPGVSNNNSVKIFIDSAYNYNYDVDWDNDGVFDSLNITTEISHQYNFSDTVTIRIRGQFPAIVFGDSLGKDSEKLIEVEQWGTTVWRKLESGFSFCRNLKRVSLTDQPNLQQITSLSELFYYCKEFNSDISSWDVSMVKDMSRMFNNTNTFNQNINSWNVDSVINMAGMFGTTFDFNQPLNNWNVSSVLNMKEMFSNSFVFNQDLSSWNVSNVEDMSGMFSNTFSFNQPIGNWSTAAVEDMSSMFAYTVSFNQSLASWDVGNVTDMSAMFNNAQAFNDSIGNWDVSRVKNMQDMFANTSAFNQDIGNWVVDSVFSMARMFTNTTAFNQDISNWNTHNVHDMSFIFSRASSFNQPIGKWDISALRKGIGMFWFASSFDQNLGSWDIDSLLQIAVFLNNSGMSVSNYDRTLSGWLSQADTGRVSQFSVGVSGLRYCFGDSSRNALIAKNWRFMGDSKTCNLVGLIKSDDSIIDIITVFPNPSSGLIDISGVSYKESQIVQLFNSRGQLLKEEKYNGQQLDYSEFSEGLYFVRLGSSNIKLMISK